MGSLVDTVGIESLGASVAPISPAGKTGFRGCRAGGMRLWLAPAVVLRNRTRGLCVLIVMIELLQSHAVLISLLTYVSCAVFVTIRG